MPTDFLHLHGWQVTDIKEGVYDYRVDAVYTIEPTDCPHCGQKLMFGNLYRHGAKDQLIMDQPVRGKRVGILLTRRRYRCRGCLKTFPQPIPDVEPRSAMTKRLTAYVEKQSIIKTFVSIAEDVGVDEKTVRNICAAGKKRPP